MSAEDEEIEIARARAIAKQKAMKAEGRALPRLDPLPQLPPVESPRMADTSLKSKLRAAMMGATWNAAPRIVELNDPHLFQKSPEQSATDLRTRQSEFTQSAEDNPGSAIAGAVLAPNPLAKASLPVRMLGSAGTNALAGYLGADTEDPEAQYVGGEMGALTGAVGEAGGDLVFRGGGKLLKGAGGRALDFGRKRALATLSPSKTDMGLILQQPGRAAEMADDLFGSGVVGPLSNTEDVAKRLAPIVEKRGSHIGEVLRGVDAPDAVNPGDVTDRIRYDATQKLQPYPAKERAFERVLDEADLIDSKYGGPMSLADSEKFLKSGYDDAAVKALKADARGAAPAGETEALDLVRRSIKNQNEAIFDARAAGTPLEGQFTKAKKSYGLAAEALNVADKTGGPKAANRFLSPSDYGFGIASGQAYQPSALLSAPVEQTVAGLVGSVLHNQARTRGSALMSHAGYVGGALADKGGELLETTAGAGAAAFRRYLLEHSAKPGSDDAAQHFLDGN